MGKLIRLRLRDHPLYRITQFRRCTRAHAHAGRSKTRCIRARLPDCSLPLDAPCTHWRLAASIPLCARLSSASRNDNCTDTTASLTCTGVACCWPFWARDDRPRCPATQISRGNTINLCHLPSRDFQAPPQDRSDPCSLSCPMTAHLARGDRSKHARYESAVIAGGAAKLPWVMSTDAATLPGGEMTSYSRTQTFSADSPRPRTCRALLDAGRGRAARDRCALPPRSVAAKTWACQTGHAVPRFIADVCPCCLPIWLGCRTILSIRSLKIPCVSMTMVLPGPTLLRLVLAGLVGPCARRF